MARPFFAVVVPMYNEIVGAESCIRTVLAELSRIGKGGILIVVDDGSRDGTGELLDRLRATAGGFEIVHKSNGGYGSALVAGARLARQRGAEFVLFMDSDLTNPPNHIARFVQAMGPDVDLIKGCRFCPGGGIEGVPFRRTVVSRLGNVVASALYRVGVPDCTNGFRAIRTDFFLSLPLRETGFPIIVEELYWVKRRGGRIVAVPTILYDRSAAQRPTRFRYSPRTIGKYLRYAIAAFFLSTRR